MTKKAKDTTVLKDKLSPQQLQDNTKEEIRQLSQYNDHNQAAPLNDIFFEGKSNPLSSRGN